VVCCCECSGDRDRRCAVVNVVVIGTGGVLL